MTTLADVIAAIESNNNDHALRFEPATFSRLGTQSLTNKGLLQKIAIANKCSIQTACMIAATSWGRFQIMGLTLYSRPIDYNGGVLAYLDDQPDMQDWAFRSFIAHHGIDYPLVQLAGDQDCRERFAMYYNGPGNTKEYGGRIADELMRRGLMPAPGSAEA
jgi:hypothetical protein